MVQHIRLLSEDGETIEHSFTADLPRMPPVVSWMGQTYLRLPVAGSSLRMEYRRADVTIADDGIDHSVVDVPESQDTGVS